VPEEGDACPTEREPITDYSELVPILRSFTLSNPFTFDCDPTDPSEADTCDTDPPLQEGGACVAEFSGPAGTCPDSWSYSLSTYPGTFEEARADSSVYVTHAGRCGTCSSLQDLSVYLDLGLELRDKAADCGIRGRFEGASVGEQCYRDLGFTDACAVVWFYNAKVNSEECLGECLVFTLLGLDSNGPPPECELAGCLECDENAAGPLFLQYAARTRRNSGLLGNIVRPCSQVVELVHEDPCI